MSQWPPGRVRTYLTLAIKVVYNTVYVDFHQLCVNDRKATTVL